MEPLLFALAAAILALLLIYRLVLRQMRRRVRTHARLGRRAEHDGYRLLERRGYTVLSRQAQRDATLDVDGTTQTFTVRADAWVERDGRRFVAEIKSGQSATVTSRATRRQLLEYAYAFGIDEVLLVDPGEGTVAHVRFRGLTSAGTSPYRR